LTITEEMLAPYRDSRGHVRINGYSPISGPSRLPDQLFTSSETAFFWGESNGDHLDLALVFAFVVTAPVLKPHRSWIGLEHQCGGYSNRVERLIATRLTPRSSVLPHLERIAREGCYAEAGHFSQSNLLASRIVWYSAALAEIGVDCESSWRHLNESLYPVDATQSNLDRLCEDSVDLNEVVEWNNYLRSRYSADPAIFFICENSD
jgi:hypothetical protein